MIQPLNLPKVPLQLTRSKTGIVSVFCIIRKKKLVLTPEEWVRQHFVHFMINQMAISPGRIISEMPLVYNKMNRRGDIVVLDGHGKPLLLVECKAPEIKIDEKTFGQIAVYNSVLKVPFLVMTNGLDHFSMFTSQSENKRTNDLDELVSWWSKQ